MVDAEKNYGTTTILRLLTVEEVSLLSEVAQQFPGTLIEERESEGEAYVAQPKSYTELRYLDRRGIVPEGHRHIAVTTDPRNFPSIWQSLDKAKKISLQNPAPPNGLIHQQED